jgi:hypothetical protein
MILVVLALVSACATLDVSMKPPTFKDEEYVRAACKGLELKATAIEGADRYWELFDDYLPEIGIAAVWAVLRNTGDSAIDLSRSKWGLRFHGQICASLSTEQVFRLYYKRRKIRFFHLETDAQARARFEGSSSLRPVFLPPRGEQAGWLLFNLSLAPEPDWGRNATLALQDVHFGKDDKADLILPLNHANTSR